MKAPTRRDDDQSVPEDSTGCQHAGRWKCATLRSPLTEFAVAGRDLDEEPRPPEGSGGGRLGGGGPWQRRHRPVIDSRTGKARRLSSSLARTVIAEPGAGSERVAPHELSSGFGLRFTLLNHDCHRA